MYAPPLGAGPRRALATSLALSLGVATGVSACSKPADPGAVRAVSPAGRSAEHAPPAIAGPTVVVYKSPACGCCTNWVEHMRAHGFAVEVRDTTDVAPARAAHGVTERLASCHTALVGGYVVEGHVPAEDVRRLLLERPAVAGLAAPGMPTGSPGMEVPGAPGDRFDVVAFDRAGAAHVYASHGPR